jgi:nucleoid DNA-binding protein
MDEAVNCSTEKQTQDKIIGNIHTALISALSSEQEVILMNFLI